MITSSGIFERVGHWHDEEWFALLYESMTGAAIDGLSMPTFPPAEVQIAMHGHANEVSVREAILFYQEVVRHARAAGRRISPEHTLLDFGTGWGRMLRPFMRDIPGSNIYACEPDSERVVLARQCNPYVNFIQSSYSPPLGLRSSTIDLIAAWSVFSHLSESAANEWILELTRILTPGGLMFITTQGTGFFDFCERLHAEKKQEGSLSHPWHETLVAQFPDPAEARRRYDSGEFVWKGWQGQQYGEAAISLNYVRSHWLRDLELVVFVDDSARLPQALIVLQRRDLSRSAAASPGD